MTSIEPREYQLSDRYLADAGQVYLSGIQALARIPIEQLRLDHARGRVTSAFVSGYPGSPLGGFDQELARARRLVPELDLVHLPAVNEELGASAVLGSQLAATRPDLRPEGVIGVWYGKAPGLDRATDALRHATFAGASATGGAIALVGDDPNAKSSTMPSSSDAALVDLHMPVLYPGTVRECLELGLHGIAMSRATGLWSAIKIVTPVADATETVTLPVLTTDPVLPTIEVDGRRWTHRPSAQFLGPRMVAAEQEFHEIRLQLAHDYGVENGLNVVTADPADAWIGLIATGYTYHELLEAFRRLGLEGTDAIAAAGIRLLHLRMPVPFDEGQIARFARGLDEIFVVEEKNPTLEQLVRDTLYPTDMRPLVTGKHGPERERLLPSHGMLDADAILPGLRARLATRLDDRLAPLPRQRELIPLTEQRTPFFCSGCPHNWGTKVPEGSVVGMGTGCHGMTLLMDPERVGDSIGVTAMGNEGTQWFGMAPFVGTDHVIQNLGDGTYFHSGQLAVQAAIGAGVNMTFKILYNRTVAMTGGQDASHTVEPAQLASILLHHGARRVVITADDLSRYDDVTLPDGVTLHDRTELVALQERFAEIEGVTIIIHDQACAAELRRARKRGKAATPGFRVVINHRICEGCGDCGDVSNCLSVQPLDTPLGRKTHIDQDSCNFDMSCLQGDCPAFMTVEVADDDHDDQHDGADAFPGAELADHPVPAPPAVERDAVAVRLAGIGGTGVVSAAQITGTAAMFDGWEVDGVDQTGLSQKAGPVVSDLALTRGDAVRRSKVVGTGDADVVVAFDQLVAASPTTLESASPERTVTIASTTTTPIGARIANPQLPSMSAAELADRLAAASRTDGYRGVDAVRAARALTGTAATANVFLLGVAVQAGAIPVSVESMHRAIDLNGVAIGHNLAAFEWGRRWAHDPAAVDAEIDRRVRDAGTEPTVSTRPLTKGLAKRVDALGLDDDLDREVRMLAADLIEYQDRKYAGRFLDLVDAVRTAERAVDDPIAMTGGLTAAVARGYHKLLAYKDEYEVARLMLHDDGLAAARAIGGPDADITWHLHPPVAKAFGVDRKLRFGDAAKLVFRSLRHGKRLRGTKLDPFGRAEVRKVEQALPVEYEAAIRRVLDRLGADTIVEATAIAALPDQVRGYEDLKLRRAAAYRDELETRVAALG